MERKGLGDTALEAMCKTIERQRGQLERIINELLDVALTFTSSSPPASLS